MSMNPDQMSIGSAPLTFSVQQAPGATSESPAAVSPGATPATQQQQSSMTKNQVPQPDVMAQLVAGQEQLARAMSLLVFRQAGEAGGRSGSRASSTTVSNAQDRLKAAPQDDFGRFAKDYGNANAHAKDAVRTMKINEGIDGGTVPDATRMKEAVAALDHHAKDHPNTTLRPLANALYLTCVASDCEATRKVNWYFLKALIALVGAHPKDDAAFKEEMACFNADLKLTTMYHALTLKTGEASPLTYLAVQDEINYPGVKESVVPTTGLFSSTGLFTLLFSKIGRGRPSKAQGRGPTTATAWSP